MRFAVISSCCFWNRFFSQVCIFLSRGSRALRNILSRRCHSASVIALVMDFCGGGGAIGEGSARDAIGDLPIGTRMEVGGEVILEVTQIGKECHTGCAIYRKVGTCIMPTDGVFARVIRGGVTKAGDEIKVAENKT